MSIEDSLLMAYVDGELSPEGRSEVEAAVAHSPELAERLSAMRASALPYGAAFERQVLPPVPPQLARRISELAAVNAVAPLPAKARVWPRMAAAFAAGTLFCLVALELRPNAGPLLSGAAPVAPWIQAVADYQQLYSRETLASVTEDPQLTREIVGNLRRADALAIQIPDLRSAGLAFKRVQRLNFHGQPVVQIVYLPEQGGGPVALCVTRDREPDASPRAQQVGEMQTVAWRRGNLGYVLLGKGSQIDLSRLGHRIASGEAAPLYSRRVVSEARTLSQDG
jgi:anti-sigma factor RsiW